MENILPQNKRRLKQKNLSFHTYTGKKFKTHWERENIKTKIEGEEQHGKKKKKSPQAEASALVLSNGRGKIHVNTKIQIKRLFLLRVLDIWTRYESWIRT